MNKHDILLQLEDPIVQMRMKIDQARLMMRDLMNGYFHSLSHQKAPVNGSDMIDALEFKENATRAEIVDDAICQIEEQLKALEQLLNKLQEEEQKHVLDHD